MYRADAHGRAVHQDGRLAVLYVRGSGGSGGKRCRGGRFHQRRHRVELDRIADVEEIESGDGSSGDVGHEAFLP
jgi:hypothetical protein